MRKIYRLPKKFAENWLKALRSGDFEQTKKVLYRTRDNAYCCLGVAGRLCGAPTVDLAGASLLSEKRLRNFIFPQVPEELRSAAPSSLPISLTTLNDKSVKVLLKEYPNLELLVSFPEGVPKNKPFNFKQIADFIELNTEFYE